MLYYIIAAEYRGKKSIGKCTAYFGKCLRTTFNEKNLPQFVKKYGYKEEKIANENKQKLPETLVNDVGNGLENCSLEKSALQIYMIEDDQFIRIC